MEEVRTLKDFKKALQEKLEDWLDLQIAKKGFAEYEANPDSAISHEDLQKDFGLDEKLS
jgi:hypothetical protein